MYKRVISSHTMHWVIIRYIVDQNMVTHVRKVAFKGLCTPTQGPKPMCQIHYKKHIQMVHREVIIVW